MKWLWVLSPFSVLVAAESQSPRRPVVGIVASPLKLPGAEAFGKLSWIWSTYVESLHDAGASVVPLLPHAGRAALLETLPHLDAVLWTGGEDDAGVHGATYPDVMMDALKDIYDHVSRTSLPLWATCQGFQALCVLASQDPSVVVPTYGTLGTAVSLHFTEQAFQSRLLKDAPEMVFTELGRRNSTLNFHSYGILTDSFQQVQGFQMLATDVDSHGQVFASLMEHQHLPIFASQFHPELYYFLDPHSAAAGPAVRHAIEANSYFMRYFVKEAMKSNVSNRQPVRLIDEYPVSYPPLGIFGSEAEVLFLGKTLQGYVFNNTTPLTASELEAAQLALQKRGSGLLGPTDGPWLARFTVAAVAVLTAGILSRLLRRPLPKGASEPLLASP